MRAEPVIRILTIVLVALLVAGGEACPLDEDYGIGAQTSPSPSPTVTVSASPSQTPDEDDDSSSFDDDSSSSSSSSSGTSSSSSSSSTSSSSSSSSSAEGLISALSMLSNVPSEPEDLNAAAAESDRLGGEGGPKARSKKGHLGRALSGDSPESGEVVPGLSVDSDRDGVADWKEQSSGYDPNDPSSLPAPTTFLRTLLAGSDDDGDGVSNKHELELGTNPGRPDSDGDGIIDGSEILSGSDPLNSGSIPEDDRDGDGLSDQVEAERGTNSNSRDTDGDRATDSLELAIGTDPLSPDTDRDGFSDGTESQYGSNPLVKD